MCWNLHFILCRPKACDRFFLKRLRHRVCLHCGVLGQPAGLSKEVLCVRVPAHLSVRERHEVSCEACSVPFWLVVSSPQTHPDWLVCPHRLIPQLETEWHHQWHHKPGQSGDRMTSPMTSQIGQAGDRMTSPMTPGNPPHAGGHCTALVAELFPPFTYGTLYGILLDFQYCVCPHVEQISKHRTGS